MWRKLGKFVLQYRIPLLILLAVSTFFMAYWGKNVKMSYEFSRAIPPQHPTNVTFQEFRKKFGGDGNLYVIGLQTDKLFTEQFFNRYALLNDSLKNLTGVESVISIPDAFGLLKDTATEKLKAVKVFAQKQFTQEQLDSVSSVFLSLPFYKGLLYNPDTKAFLMGVRINDAIMNSPKRNEVTSTIRGMAENFAAEQNETLYLSGLPFIRTEMSTRIAKEMQLFLLASVVLSALILLIFFRSISATILSISVVIIGVLFCVGTMYLFKYDITLLTALIPPLIVVIGIPNCIYFLNKYHSSWQDTVKRLGGVLPTDKKALQQLKNEALVNMVGRMGVVTLFCNLAAGIGFAVFALTESQILREFGVIAGINIMLLFVISLIIIPGVLSYLPVPKKRHTRYLDNKRLQRWLDRLERWALNHRRLIYTVTAVLLIGSVIGIFKLKSVGYMVDDIPKSDKVYTDLKFFEKNFRGIMPLEIVVDTRKKQGAVRNINNLTKMDELSGYIASMPEMARPLSIIEGLKFAKQAFFDGDSSNYSMPSDFMLPGLVQYLNMRQDSATNNAGGAFTKILSSFMDSTKQQARISVNMADVGTIELPKILDKIRDKAEILFNEDSIAYTKEVDSLKKVLPAADLAKQIDSSRLLKKADIQLTGTSITFLEGSKFIINGLKESIFYAFLLISLCMLYLFKSLRILICSLIPNVIPLIITAGVMGWSGVPLKPSTVLVFSVALGIAIDITIRFLVNYKQELPRQANNARETVIETIHSTGISIIYTSLVLIAGFVIFCFSGFGGTFALGWLTSLTLVVATFTNLVLLPALLITVNRKKKG